MKLNTFYLNIVYLIGFLLIFVATCAYFLINSSAGTILFSLYMLIISLFIYFICSASIHFKKDLITSLTASFFSSTLIFIFFPLPFLYLFHMTTYITSIQLANYLSFIALISTLLFISTNFFSYYFTNRMALVQLGTSIYFILCILLICLALLVISLFPTQTPYFMMLIPSYSFIRLCLLMSWLVSIYLVHKKLALSDQFSLYKQIIHLKHFIFINIISCFAKDSGLHFLLLLTSLLLLYTFCFVIYKEFFLKSVWDVYKSFLIQEQGQLFASHYTPDTLYKNLVRTKKDFTPDATYTQLLEFYPDAFMIISNGIIIHHNKHAEKLLHIKKSRSLLHRPFSTLIDSSDLDLVGTLIHELHTMPSDSITSQFQLLTDDGDTIDVEAIFACIQSSSDAFLLSAKDVSHRKANAAISHQFEIEKLKVEFFSSLSHELKTPVNIIYSAAQLQQQFFIASGDSKQFKYAEVIGINCLRLIKLINNLLDLNRIESDYFNLQPKPINIVEVTEAIFDSITPYAKQKNLTLLFDTDSETYCVCLDPELYERTLLNLFSNAVKYTPSGGNIWCNLYLEASSVSIEIKDNGIGIPSENLETIFKRFVRIENGLIRQVDGAGIGLSLVKSFTELNKGSISVSSTLNLGTSFTLTFPIASTSSPIDSFSVHDKNKEKVKIEFSDFHVLD